MPDEESKEYREQLYKVWFGSGAEFDRLTIYIASGILGVSFSFSDDIVDLDTATNKWLMITSWVLSAIVIMISLISHHLTKKAAGLAIENEESDRAKRLDCIIDIMNISIIFMLFSSIILVTIFVGINFK